MEKCDKSVPNTNLLCGQVHGVYCSDECAKLIGEAELAELGITPEMLKDALSGYYECKDMIVEREKTGSRRTVNRPDRPAQSPYESAPE